MPEAQLRLNDLIALNEEIVALVRAGVPLERGLADLARELPRPASGLAARLAARTESGATLVEAIEAEGPRLPAAYRAVVRAGLRSGRLDAALAGVVDTGRRLAEVRRVGGLALLYPLIVVAAAWLLMAMALTVLLPEFQKILSPGAEGPASLAGGLGFVAAGVVLLMGVIAVGLAVSWWRAGRAKAAIGSRGSVLGRGRFASLRRIRGLSQAAAFADCLALLVEHNVPLHEAIRLAVDASGAQALRASAEAIATRLESGGRVADAGPEIDAWPSLIRLALLSDRDQAVMVAGLETAAAAFRQRADQDADWCMLRMPVFLTLLLGGGTVAAYAALVLGPYIRSLHVLSRWI